ncbi:hypothetical protein [Luteimicrobium album]|uniref:hypothetical protein n=1 Tax=Luteimicrobium album TaxID=1054550 RepID=UPI0024E18EC7|nr:hypothetical protein [Luteimicrobium album]
MAHIFEGLLRLLEPAVRGAKKFLDPLPVLESFAPVTLSLFEHSCCVAKLSCDACSEV